MLVICSLKFWKCKQVEIWIGWWNMRSQVGACVISLGNSIKEACCFECGFTAYSTVQDLHYLFWGNAKWWKKWAKDGFVQEKGFFFMSWHSSFSEFADHFLNSLLPQQDEVYFSLFWFREIQHRHLKCIFYMDIGFYFTIKLTFFQCYAGNIHMWIHLV